MTINNKDKSILKQVQCWMRYWDYSSFKTSATVNNQNNVNLSGSATAPVTDIQLVHERKESLKF